MNRMEVVIPVEGGVKVMGNLSIPEKAVALVIFSHGSGSSRFSSRNRLVAERLNSSGMATLLTDLLTPEEDLVYENRFDIGLLTDRLVAATRAVTAMPELGGLPVGYFGASTGAASALRAAARLGVQIGAVVSRGGRPDLATDQLPRVQAPTLLIVGSLDGLVITLNKEAFTALQCVKSLQIIEGASHLFEEPGKLEKVAEMATQWLCTYLLKQSLKN